MNTIAVVDYGMGNLRSVANALKQAAPDANIVVSGDPKTVSSADRIVFPGQGAMPDCMRQLNETGLTDVLKQAARQKPFMGICIGLQMLFSETEEGQTEGLNLLPGTVKRFSTSMTDGFGKYLKVPQMGWNTVSEVQQHPLWNGVEDHSWFYFVHSYYVSLGQENANLMVGETDYGIPYASAVAKDNLFGVQFHPEKSGAYGIQILSNFAKWTP